MINLKTLNDIWMRTDMDALQFYLIILGDWFITLPDINVARRRNDFKILSFPSDKVKIRQHPWFLPPPR